MMTPRATYALLVSLPLALGLLACDSGEGEPLPDPEATERKPLPKVDMNKKAERVVSRPGQTEGRFTGNLTAKDEVTVSPKSTGTIIKLPVTEGQKVKKGDLLFSLDKRASGLNVSQARAALKAAEVQLEQAERNLKRQQGLAQRGSASPATLEQAESAYEAAKVGVEQAKVGISLSRSSLGDRSVYAPIDGVVTSLDAELGELVNMTPPTTVMEIKNLDVLELRVRVPETALRVARPGSTIFAKFPALDLEREVKVTRIGDQVDPVTRTIELIADIDNEDGILRPGMFVEIRTAETTESDPGDAPAAARDEADEGEPAAPETAAQGPQDDGDTAQG